MPKKKTAKGASDTRETTPGHTRPHPSPTIAFVLAEQSLLERDPALLAYLASQDRTADPVSSAELIAERLARLSASPSDRLTAAVAYLEILSADTQSRIQAVDTSLQRIEERLDAVERRAITRLGAGAIAISVILAGLAALAGVVQILEYLAE